MESILPPLQPDASRYTLARFVEDVAARHEDRLALRFPAPQGDDSALSYRELEQRARALARGLIASGVVKGARVAVWMANRPEWVISAYAVAMAGGVLVPLNTFATPEERDYILRHSDASVLLMQPGLMKHRFLEDLTRDHPELSRGEPGQLHCPALPNLRRVACLGDAPAGGIERWSSLSERGARVPEPLLEAVIEQIDPSDDGILIYTSGTTAHPKGVLHYQRTPVLMAWRIAELFRMEREDVLFTAYPFFWSAGIAMSLGAGLAAGATVLLAEVFDPESGLAQIEQFHATVLHAWPHHEKALAEHPTASQRDLTSLRKVNFNSPLAALAGHEKDVFGTGGTYGMTETFTIASGIPADAPAELRERTSGKPLPGMRFRIVDPTSGEVLPRGEKGEIAIKGPTLMRGYYKVASENVFDEDGYFHTQDGGSFDEDGHLSWTGRLSNLIKTGGANVSPIEIQDQLTTYPGMKAAIALGIEHAILGEIVVLCAVPNPGFQIEPEAVQAHLQGRLSAYKRPKLVLVFDESELSYTGNQKIQVEPLKEKALARMKAEEIEVDGVRYSGSG